MDGDPGAPGAQGAKVTDSSELVLSCNRQLKDILVAIFS